MTLSELRSKVRRLEARFAARVTARLLVPKGTAKKRALTFERKAKEDLRLARLEFGKLQKKEERRIARELAAAQKRRERAIAALARLRQSDGWTYGLPRTRANVFDWCVDKGYNVFGTPTKDYDGEITVADVSSVPLSELPVNVDDNYNLGVIPGLFWAAIVKFRSPEEIPEYTDDADDSSLGRGETKEDYATGEYKTVWLVYQTSTGWHQDPRILDITIGALIQNAIAKHGALEILTVSVHVAARVGGKRPGRLDA